MIPAMVIAGYLLIGLITAITTVRSLKHYRHWVDIHFPKARADVYKHYGKAWALVIVFWPVVLIEKLADATKGK